MKTYFTTEIKNVKINGVLRENVQIVTGIQTTSDDNGIPQYTELPKEYSNANVMGMAYLPNETPIFQQIDIEEVEEETQYQTVTKEDLENAKLDILECLVDMAETMSA